MCARQARCLLLRELHRVVQHVEQDLAEPPDVAEDRLGHAFVDLGHEFEALADATEPMSASTPSTQARKSNGAISSSNRPASTFE